MLLLLKTSNSFDHETRWNVTSFASSLWLCQCSTGVKLLIKSNWSEWIGERYQCRSRSTSFLLCEKWRSYVGQISFWVRFQREMRNSLDARVTEMISIERILIDIESSSTDGYQIKQMIVLAQWKETRALRHTHTHIRMLIIKERTLAIEQMSFFLALALSLLNKKTKLIEICPCLFMHEIAHV